MNIFLNRLSNITVIFFEIYLLIYSSFLFIALSVGAWNLFKGNQMTLFRSELKHDYYLPVSILVPAYNEEVTIVDTVKSLLNLDYKLFEIIVVDDGSVDRTSSKLIDAFNLKLKDIDLQTSLLTKPHSKIYGTYLGDIRLTLVTKENGGKGDALNMGINLSSYPYFLTIDADSILQRDSLEKIVQPVFKNDCVVAVGGFINVAQTIKFDQGEIKDYQIPKKPIVGMQVVEYYRSFLASRILLNELNGNIIISGAFGLFKKDIVIGAGGYSTDTVGEDMDIVLKIHTYCRNNNKKYTIEYEPNALCWSEVPSSLKDLIKQRKRWYLGLFQCMSRYRFIFINVKFGLLSTFSYMYYLFFELLSPAVEIFGMVMVLVFYFLNSLDGIFMIKFFFLYSLYGVFVSFTAFLQIIFLKKMKFRKFDLIKITIFSLMEGFILRYIMSFIRLTAFIGYKDKKMHWGSLKRSGYNK